MLYGYFLFIKSKSKQNTLHRFNMVTFYRCHLSVAPKSKSKQDVPEKCYINLFMYYITLHTL